jgi:hypothetical protein
MSERQLRIGDAEREQAATALGEHFAQGRLSLDEHAERLDQVWAARTRGELEPVFRDLPGGRGPVRPATRGYWHGGVRPFRRGLPTPLFVVLAILVVFTVVTHLPVVLIGLGVWWFVASRHRGHRRPMRS